MNIDNGALVLIGIFLASLLVAIFTDKNFRKASGGVALVSATLLVLHMLGKI